MANCDETQILSGNELCDFTIRTFQRIGFIPTRYQNGQIVEFTTDTFHWTNAFANGLKEICGKINPLERAYLIFQRMDEPTSIQPAWVNQTLANGIELGLRRNVSGFTAKFYNQVPELKEQIESLSPKGFSVFPFDENGNIIYLTSPTDETKVYPMPLTYSKVTFMDATANEAYHLMIECNFYNFEPSLLRYLPQSVHGIQLANWKPLRSLSESYIYAQGGTNTINISVKGASTNKPQTGLETATWSLREGYTTENPYGTEVVNTLSSITASQSVDGDYTLTYTSNFTAGAKYKLKMQSTYIKNGVKYLQNFDTFLTNEFTIAT